MIDEGIYDAKIVTAHIEVDDRNDGELSLVFGLILDGGAAVTARHRTGGKWGHIGRDVALSLGIEWPDGLERIADTAGAACRVKIKHNEGKNGQMYENAYIHLARDLEPASSDQVKAGIKKLRQKETDDNIPF